MALAQHLHEQTTAYVYMHAQAHTFERSMYVFVEIQGKIAIIQRMIHKWHVNLTKIYIVCLVHVVFSISVEIFARSYEHYMVVIQWFILLSFFFFFFPSFSLSFHSLFNHSFFFLYCSLRRAFIIASYTYYWSYTLLCVVKIHSNSLYKNIYILYTKIFQWQWLALIHKILCKMFVWR